MSYRAPDPAVNMPESCQSFTSTPTTFIARLVEDTSGRSQRKFAFSRWRRFPMSLFRSSYSA